VPVITKQIARPGTVKPNVTSVIDRIAPISFNEDDGLKLMVYGKSGTGKTTFWATFPKPILVVVCSGSLRPGELRSINTEEYRKTVRQVVLHDSQELKAISEHVRAGELQGKPEYKTVVLDHVSGFQDLVMKEVLNLKEIPAQKTWGIAQKQHWGQIGIQVKELCRGLLDLNANVVIVGQERTDTPDEGSEVIAPSVGVGLTPGAAGWLNTAVEYIVQTFLRQNTVEVKTTVGVGKEARVISTFRPGKGVEYCLRTGPDATYTTKFRVPRGSPLPDVIPDADYEKVRRVANGEPL
jgi:hypothetical protein